MSEFYINIVFGLAYNHAAAAGLSMSQWLVNPKGEAAKTYLDFADTHVPNPSPVYNHDVVVQPINWKDKLPGATVLVYFTLTYYNFKATGPVTFTSDIVDIHIVEPAEEVDDPLKRRNDSGETGPMFPSPKKRRVRPNIAQVDTLADVVSLGSPRCRIIAAAPYISSLEKKIKLPIPFFLRLYFAPLV